MKSKPMGGRRGLYGRVLSTLRGGGGGGLPAEPVERERERWEGENV